VIALGILCLAPLALMIVFAAWQTVRACIEEPWVALVLLGAVLFAVLTFVGIVTLASIGIGGHA